MRVACAALVDLPYPTFEPQELLINLEIADALVGRLLIIVGTKIN